MRKTLYYLLEIHLFDCASMTGTPLNIQEGAIVPDF
jgi:hypothetical protein